MSLGVFPKKFNNLFRSLEFFNPADFSEQVYVENLVSDNIQSTNVLSNNLQSVDAENGDSVSVATQNYVAAQVNALIGGSGQLLDTLGEISDALQGDGNFAGHVWNKFGDVDSSLASVNSHLTVLDASGVAVNTRLNAHDSHFTQLDASGNVFNTRLNAHDTSLNNLAAKTNAISYDSGTNTTVLNSKLVVALSETNQGATTIGNDTGDTLVINAQTTFANSNITGLTKANVGLSNVDNVSDINKSISTATQNALNLKSNDNSVVHLSGSETISGTKTFSLAPVLPNNSISNAMINNSCINSGFCDGTSSIQNQISARALDSAVVHNSGSESISGQKTFSTGITLNGTDLNTRISGIETLNTSQSSSITGLQQKTASLSYDSASDTLSLASRISISKDILENGSIYLGDSSGNDIIYIKGNLNANSSTITPVQLSYLSTLTGNVKDSLDSKATITYVDTSISSLINSAPTALNTLNELALALGNDANYSTTITTALATKAADSTVVHNSGSESISGQKTFSTGITLNGTDLNTRISGIETTNTSQSSSITSLQQKTSSLSYDSASDTLSLASRISISKDILENGSIYLGDSSGNDVVYLQANISASGQTITPAKMSYLSTLTGNVQTALDSKCADSLACHLSGSENLTGSKTFSGGVVLSSNITANGTTISPTELSYIDGATSNLQLQINGKQNTLTFDSTPTSGSSNPATSGGIYTALGTKQATLTFDSTPTVSSSNPCTSGGIYTALGTKQATLTFDSTPTVSSSNPCTSGGIYTALGTKQATLTFDSTPTVSSSNPCTSGGIYTALGTKQATLTFDSAPTASSSNPCTSGGIYTALGTKQGTLTFDSTPTASSSNPCTSGGTYTALQSYLTTSSAASTYATLSAPALTGNPTTTTQSSSDNSTRIASTAYVQSNLSNYGTLASSSTYSGNNTFSSYNHVNQFGELIHNAGSGSSLSLTYTSIKGVVYYTPSANFTLTLSSVPSPTSNLETYSITLIYNAKYYANAISVNGSSYTMIAGAGLSNISINASATYVMQQINICYLNSSTPTVITNVLSLW
jgi:hypothetical protein